MAWRRSRALVPGLPNFAICWRTWSGALASCTVRTDLGRVVGSGNTVWVEIQPERTSFRAAFCQSWRGKARSNWRVRNAPRFCSKLTKRF